MALHKAIDESIEAVENCLKEGCAIEEWDFYGRTPLLKVAELGKMDMMKCLIDKGANVNATDNTGETPLFCIAIWKEMDIVKLLVENGANVNAQDNKGVTPLLRAAQLGKIEMMKCLIDKGANVNAVDISGRTPLFCAVYRGPLESVQVLIDIGADVNATDNKGATPLVLAAQRGKMDIIRRLIDKGANVNATDNKGVTPLFCAAERGRMDMVKLLVDKGANVNATDTTGRSVLRLLRRHVTDVRLCELVESLLEQGLDVSYLTGVGASPMHDICQLASNSSRHIFGHPVEGSELASRYIRLLEVCLENGGDPTEVRDNDDSLLQYTFHIPLTALGYETCVRLIKLILKCRGDVAKPCTDVFGNERFPFEHLLVRHSQHVDYAGLSLLSCPEALKACRAGFFKVPSEKFTLADFNRFINSGYIYYGCIQCLSDPTRGFDAKQKLQDLLTFLNTKGLSEELLSELLKDVSPSNFGVLKDTPGDFTRLKNATFSLFHLSRREVRNCVFQNHTLRLPDPQSVNEELKKHIGDPEMSYLKIF